MYVANVAEGGFKNNPHLDAVTPARASRRTPKSSRCARRSKPRSRSSTKPIARLPAGARARRAGPESRDPRRLQAARSADVLHCRAEGSARLDRADRRDCAAGRRRDPHRLRERASSAPKSSPTTTTSRTRASRARRKPANCGSKARSTSSTKAMSCTSASTSEGAVVAVRDFEIRDERFRQCIRTSANIERLHHRLPLDRRPGLLPGAALAAVQRHSERSHAALRRAVGGSERFPPARRLHQRQHGRPTGSAGLVPARRAPRGAHRARRLDHRARRSLRGQALQQPERRRRASPTTRSGSAIPSYGIDSNYEGFPVAERARRARVYRIDPRSGEVRVVADGFAQPNGLAFSVDERRMYIVDSRQGTRHHARVRVHGDELRGGDVFIECADGSTTVCAST